MKSGEYDEKQVVDLSWRALSGKGKDSVKQFVNVDVVGWCILQDWPNFSYVEGRSYE
jgi:hypothetical protein